MSFKSTPVKTSIGEKALRSEILLPLRIILAFAYGLLVKMRNFLYDNNIVKTRCVATPVFSVGNLSVGGSGKTIVVQALIKHLEDQNKKVCVLSRGYGRQSRGPLLVSDGRELLETVSRAGDEPYLIAMNYPGTPVLVAEDRYQGARLLEKQFKPDIILLDDGFQHRWVKPAFSLVLTRADNIFTRDSHLPSGRLRESKKEI
jgi:tetraacyldisaccharide 4'-kinase